MMLRRKNTTKKLIKQRKLNGLRIVHKEEDGTNRKAQEGKNV